MDNRANEAYLIAIINNYERQINKKTTATMKTMVLKEVIGNLGDLLDFMSDKKATESKSTLELNADLTESARVYKNTIAEQECTITTLAMDLSNAGYLEQENRLLDAENLMLNSKLAVVREENEKLRNSAKVWKSKWDENISC